MTLGNSWSYAPDDHYKSSRKVVHMLVDIVAKGGNYLLNVGPDPNGELPTAAVARLAEIGAWMQANGEAIYATRPVAPYRDGKVCFTRGKDGAVYAIYLLDQDEAVPATIALKNIVPASGTSVRLLGYDTALKWQREGTGARVTVPEAVRNQAANSCAVSLRIAAARVGGTPSHQ